MINIDNGKVTGNGDIAEIISDVCIAINFLFDVSENSFDGNHLLAVISTNYDMMSMLVRERMKPYEKKIKSIHNENLIKFMRKCNGFEDSDN